MPLTQRDAPYRHWEFQDPLSGDLLRLVPERGGLITGWRCQGRELLYLDEQRFADPALSVRGGMPVLFPICGGLPGNRLPLPEGDFTLAQHGFGRDLPWRLEPLADGGGVAMELEDSTTTLAAYPFGFRLRLEARLSSDALAISVTVTHRSPAQHNPEDADASHSNAAQASGGVMPFSFGLHPYFAVSELEQVSVEGLPDACFDHLTMAPAASSDLLPQLPAGVDLLARPGGAPVRLRDRGNGRVIELQTSAPWDLVVLWSEPPRPMVCLEPWTGPRQALISGDHRLELAPGEAITLHSRFVLAAAGT